MAVLLLGQGLLCLWGAQLAVQAVHSALKDRSAVIAWLGPVLCGVSVHYKERDYHATPWSVCFAAVVVALATGSVFMGAVVALSPLRTVMRLYIISRGAGLNVFWRSRRLLALDAHDFLIKSEHEPPRWVWRPHVHFPLLHVHHWPYGSDTRLAKQRKLGEWLFTSSPHAEYFLSTDAAEAAAKRATPEHAALKELRAAKVLEGPKSFPALLTIA